MDPNISVIIPAYNSAGTIKQAVVSVLTQKYPTFELIIIDDGSTDGTSEEATKAVCDCAHYPAAGGTMIMKSNINRGPAAARNTGLKAAKGQTIVFLDADAVAPQGWLQAIAKKNDMIFGGDMLPLYAGKTPAERKAIAFEVYRRNKIYGGEMKLVSKLPSCNLIADRAVLGEGFDETFKYPSAEDYDLCMRLDASGVPIHYEPDVFVFHAHQTDRRRIMAKARMHARENILLRKKRTKITPNGERLRAYGRALIFPLIALIRYPPRFWRLGLEYEYNVVKGSFDGIYAYWGHN